MMNPWMETTPLGARELRVAAGRDATGTLRYVAIPLDTFRTHAQITATTGAGKSHLGKVILAEALRIGAGCGVLDFKGDLVQDMLRMIPQERWADVVVIDPMDAHWPVGLNLLDPSMLQGGQEVDLLVSQLEAAIVSLDENWKSSVGMQQFLGWGGKALVDGEPYPTLDHLYTFFASDTYRAEVLANVSDITTKLWWEQTFPTLPENQLSSIAPLQRRLDQFRMNGIVRRMCNQATTSIPFRRVLDERGILLARLPTELIGEKEGAFLASLVINLIVAAAFTRQAVPEAERETWLLFVDEFQEAIGRGDPGVYKKILERLRSFGVGLLLAHQHMGQLDRDILDSTLNIVRTRFILSALGDDATIWARQYGSQGVTREDFANIPIRDEGYMTTELHGLPLPLFTFEPLPLWPRPAVNGAPPPAEMGDWQQLAPPARSEQESFLDTRIRQFQASNDEAAQLHLMVRCPADLWVAFKARTAAWRHYQREQILAEPGLIADDADRLRWLSRLRVARPGLEVQADMIRRALQFPRAEVDGHGGKRGKPHQGGAVSAHTNETHGRDAATNEERQADARFVDREPTTKNEAGVLAVHAQPHLQEHAVAPHTIDNFFDDFLTK